MGVFFPIDNALYGPYEFWYEGSIELKFTYYRKVEHDSISYY